MMSTPAIEKLSQFYARFSNEDHVLVLINADPDAIAAAMCVKRLLWRHVANVSICHVNVVKRPDNLAMIRLLDVNMTYIKEVEAHRFSRFVLVDSQPNHHEAFGQFRFDVIIDHHPDTKASADFIDLRPKYGATASILTEYLRAARIKPSVKLATGLFYAIKTDTNNFQRQTLIEDLRAFQFLFRHANMHLARRFETADLRLDFLKYFQIALNVKCIRRNRVFVHLGEVANPDICVIIADFFLRISSISWSIVSGICDDTLVVILRNDGLNKNAGRVAQKGFSAFGSAGGHKSTARAEIEIKKLRKTNPCDDGKGILHWIIQRIERSDGNK